MEQERQERLAALEAEIVDAAPVLAELADWLDNAGLGDDGSAAELIVVRDSHGHGTWDVHAHSQDDGSAMRNPPAARFRTTLRDTAALALLRIRENPQEQRDARKEQAAMAVAIWAGCGLDTARELLTAFEEESRA